MVNRSSLIIEPTQGRRSYRRVLALPRVLNPERVARGEGGSRPPVAICTRSYESRVPASQLSLSSSLEASRYADEGREIAPR